MDINIMGYFEDLLSFKYRYLPFYKRKITSMYLKIKYLINNVYTTKKLQHKILLMFIDGNDVYFQGNKKNIIQKWIEMNIDNYILFGVEPGGFQVDPNEKSLWPLSPYIKNDDYRWLNSGFYMGNLDIMNEFFDNLTTLTNELYYKDWILDKRLKRNDTHAIKVEGHIDGRDQPLFSKMFYPKRKNRMILDYKSEMFFSMCLNRETYKIVGNKYGIFYKVTNVKPLVIHWNGWSKQNSYLWEQSKVPQYSDYLFSKYEEINNNPSNCLYNKIIHYHKKTNRTVLLKDICSRNVSWIDICKYAMNVSKSQKCLYKPE
eukprot:338454_1